jgi:hypothetical protein
MSEVHRIQAELEPAGTAYRDNVLFFLDRPAARLLE